MMLGPHAVSMSQLSVVVRAVDGRWCLRRRSFEYSVVPAEDLFP